MLTSTGVVEMGMEDRGLIRKISRRQLFKDLVPGCEVCGRGRNQE